MRQPALYDDTYTGPRWRYGLTLRPITQYAGAAGLGEWIVFSDRPSDDPRFPHGTIDYPREIPESIATAVDLVPLGQVQAPDDEWGPDSATQLLERGPA